MMVMRDLTEKLCRSSQRRGLEELGCLIDQLFSHFVVVLDLNGNGARTLGHSCFQVSQSLGEWAGSLNEVEADERTGAIFLPIV